jgi:hypothetical protein
MYFCNGGCPSLGFKNFRIGYEGLAYAVVEPEKSHVDKLEIWENHWYHSNQV